MCEKYLIYFIFAPTDADTFFFHLLFTVFSFRFLTVDSSMTRSTGDLEAINLEVDSVASSPGTTRVSEGCVNRE